MLQMLAKLLKVLNSEVEPGQISLAFCFAMVAGFTPLLSLHNLLVLFLILLLRVNLSAFILGLLFFTGFAYMLDPIFHKAGLAVLSAEPMKETFTTLYNNPYWRLTHFNNTIVSGSLLVSALLFVPLYFLFNILILKYRDYVLEMIRKSKVMQFFKASKFYHVYEKVSSLRGGE